METETRVLGGLLGLAVGDALGAPLEFMSLSQIQIKHGTVREMIGGGWLFKRPGEATEETGLSVVLAESLIAKGDLDLEDVAARYADWYRVGRRDATGVLRAALSLLAEGVPPADVARRARELTKKEAEGNGTLFAAVPLALFFSDRARLAAAIRDVTALTHFEERPRAAAVAIGFVLSFVFEGAGPEEAFDQAWDALEEGTGGVPNVLPDVPSRTESQLRPTPDAVDTLEVALWEFLKAPGFEEGVVRTANLGGDADTTSALVGALLGTHLGSDVIPKRWLRSLSDRTAIRDAARELARRRT